MAPTKNPAPHTARSVADTAADDSPAAAVLAALSAEPVGATVAVIAARAGISTAAGPAGAARAREERHRDPG